MSAEDRERWGSLPEELIAAERMTRDANQRWAEFLGQQPGTKPAGQQADLREAARYAPAEYVTPRPSQALTGIIEIDYPDADPLYYDAGHTRAKIVSRYEQRQRTPAAGEGDSACGFDELG